MPARYFTVEEANALLPEIRPLVAELMEKQAAIANQRQSLGRVGRDFHNNVGSALASAMTQEFTAVETLQQRIQAYGCVLKNPGVGLLDFLADMNGRDVYLCWKYDEPAITHYHDLHTGFNGRIPLNPNQ